MKVSKTWSDKVEAVDSNAVRRWIYSDGGPLHQDLVEYIVADLGGAVSLKPWF